MKLSVGRLLLISCVGAFFVYLIILPVFAISLSADINGDGKVDSTDMKLVLSGWLGRGACSLPGTLIYSCDIFQDAKVNSFDAALVLAGWTFPLPSPSLSPLAVPYGPFAYGLPTNTGGTGNDYASPLSTAFNGSFIKLWAGSTNLTAAENALINAQNHNYKMGVNIVNSDGCQYWNSSTGIVDVTGIVNAATPYIQKVSQYYLSGTVSFVMLIDEPQNPTNCTPLPPTPLYQAAQQIRAKFALYGAGNIPIGYFAPPDYFYNGLTDAQRKDGTINVAWMQWTPAKGACGTTIADKINKWLDGTCPGGVPYRTYAAYMGYKIGYSVNSRDFVSDPTPVATVIAANAIECTLPDALAVYWYSWHDGTIAGVPLSDPSITVNTFLSALTACPSR